MNTKKEWYKKWYMVLPATVVVLPLIAFVGLVLYIIVFPDCGRPLLYTLGTIDNRFELSNEKILLELEEAEKVWENFEGKDLFEYTPKSKEADMVIDFVFDHRQMEVEESKIWNDDIKDYNNELDAYANMVIVHEERLEQYEKTVSEYESDLEKYENDVQEWNMGNRNDNNKFVRLSNESKRLDEVFAYLDLEQDSINNSADSLNLIKSDLDKRGDEYDEIYGQRILPQDMIVEAGIWDPNEEKITIFRYSNDKELKWLLAHELGHALGLEHVEYPRSVMFYKSSGVSVLSLSNDDVRELSEFCMD